MICVKIIDQMLTRIQTNLIVFLKEIEKLIFKKYTFTYTNLYVLIYMYISKRNLTFIFLNKKKFHIPILHVLLVN